MLRILLLLVLYPITLAAQPRITDTWPDAAHLLRVRVEHVTFPSSSPFGPSDAGTADAPAATVRAELFLPPGVLPDRTIPAVVMLHGAAGNIAERGAVYGPQLASMGVAVLVIDTFGSRPALGGSFRQRLLNITETMFVADAYAGLRYLASRPEIDRHHVVLTGFSYGGMATMYALYRQMADRFTPPDLRFAGHVSFYGPCIARFDDSQTTGAPLLMLYGAGDELIRPGALRRDRGRSARGRQCGADFGLSGCRASVGWRAAAHVDRQQLVGVPVPGGCGRAYLRRNNADADDGTADPAGIAAAVRIERPVSDWARRCGSSGVEPRFRAVLDGGVRACKWRPGMIEVPRPKRPADRDTACCVN